MKTPLALFHGLTFALLAMAASAQAPQAEKPATRTPARPPQVELESKFFVVSADAAARLGLTGADEASGPQRTGTMSNADLQKLLADLSAEKSVNQLAAPRVTCMSGQRAVIEIIREFRYPTEFEAAADLIAPKAFETRNTGVTLEIEPVVTDGTFIEIKLRQFVTAFHQFAHYAGGKTKAAGPIPKNGFAQPIFDSVESSVTATLRPEQSILLGGFPWHGSNEVLADEQHLLIPNIDATAAPAPQERKLLFMTITARLIQPPGGLGRANELIKAGSPVVVSTQLGAVVRGHLPDWAAPGNFLADAWTELGAVEPARAEELRKTLESAPGKAVSAEALANLGPRMAGVLQSGQTDALHKAFEAASGSPLSAGPVKTIKAGERYYAEASGALRYRPKGAGNATATTADRERVDLQLLVDAHCAEGGTIDMTIVANLATAPWRDQDAASTPRSGEGTSIEWKPLDREPRWGKPIATTTVSIWNGNSVVLVRPSEADKDHLQILLITAKAAEPSGDNAATPPASTPPPESPEKTSDPKVPAGKPVPGKAGFVTSPHAPEKGYVDVRGFPSGTEVKCPYTGKMFAVP